MFDDDMYEESKQTLTLEYSSSFDGDSKYNRRSVAVGETYTDILEELVWFLQSIGFTYIHGLTALDEQGNDLQSVHNG